MGKLKSLLMDPSPEARAVVAELEAEAQLDRERERAFREKLEQDPDLAWRAEGPVEIDHEAGDAHAPPSVAVADPDDWEFDPIFDRWPDFDLYDPNEEDTESGLGPKFERIQHYLESRAAVTGAPCTDTADGLVESFLRYGERTIHGVRVDEGGKMIVDFEEPEPGYLKKWNESHRVDALTAANVREHVQRLVDIAKHMPGSPATISECIATLAAHAPNMSARPTLRDAAARIALRVVARAEQFDLTIEELLVASNVADDLSQLRSASGGGCR